MKRLLFIYNPHAGKELLKPKLADVIDIFVKAGYEVVAYPTQAYRDAYKKIKKYDSSEYDLIVCSGGDGTLDEVVTGMMKRDRDKRERSDIFRPVQQMTSQAPSYSERITGGGRQCSKWGSICL
mgnify:CR=1 FL=1